MDESTSALDTYSESDLYALLLQEMPQTIIVSIGHRQTLQRFHNQMLVLHEHNKWQLQEMTVRSEQLTTFETDMLAFATHRSSRE